MEKPRPYAQSRPLSVEDVQLAAPGAGEVLVEVGAAGLCHSDLSVLDGSRPRVMPMVLGHEASGVVREIGEGVTEFAAGDHVVFSYVPVCGRCAECASGRGAMCERGAEANVAGTLLGGQCRFADADGHRLHHHLGVSGFSQFTVASQHSLVKIDDDVPLHKAALFGCAVMTGVGAVVNTARVEPGASVAVFGMGGVGLSAVMGARAAGAHPIIAVDTLASKLEFAPKAGASHVVDASKVDAVQAVKELTKGGPRYVFDATGVAEAMPVAYAATRRGGTTVVIGLPHPKKTAAIHPVTLVAEERTLKGSYMGSCVPRRDVPRFISMWRAGLLPVDLLHTHTIALDQINEGFDLLAAGGAVRQVIQF
jgi:alcohol dehydrogenase